MPLELELCPGRWVGGQHPCFIIAEIGQNHQGDLEVAKRLIRTAKVRGELPGRGARPRGARGAVSSVPCGLPVLQALQLLFPSLPKPPSSPLRLPPDLSEIEQSPLDLSPTPSGSRTIFPNHGRDQILLLPSISVDLNARSLPAYHISSLTSSHDPEFQELQSREVAVVTLACHTLLI